MHAELADHASAASILAAKAENLANNTALHVAIATEYVLRAIDRLEVRGRDSAGIAIQLAVGQGALDALNVEQRNVFDERCCDLNAGNLSIYHVKLDSGKMVTATQANMARLIERPITWEDRVYLTWAPDAAVVLLG